VRWPVTFSVVTTINGASCFSDAFRTAGDSSTLPAADVPGQISWRKFGTGKLQAGHSGEPIARPRTAKYANAFKAIGCFKARPRKYLSSVFQKYVFPSSHPVPARGALRIVRSVGCGMRWTRWGRQTSDLSADGQVVWS